MVFVVGKGELHRGSGGGNGSYDGGMVVAKTLDDSRNRLSSFGAPTFDWAGGGTNGINYASGCIKQQNPDKSYRVLASRELMY